ncbi:sulfatase-modifying factor domain protein [Halomicronema hongdechloris C2206]|uniref:Sulfatase-modifying factor domain protein n=1 Tax=Halomicronema hongdechloris C2206 TaxID=1641165 RepID=A0A1Z3HNS4_9CYAN|nr:SUMF1/EgtB/PvdO family nonheme iron enzyme [Halomicronema hongdechloris]ASC71961.1 sulfatase-modifying factor domain protein [Halomicronema hongdechloris C2206]
MSGIRISYASSDRPWADWIAWVLQENGYPTTAQVLDSQLEGSPVGRFQQTLESADIFLVVLSTHYVTVASTQPDWPPFPRQAPTLTAWKTVPVRVDTCQVPSHWQGHTQVDLVGQSESEAERTLLGAIEARSVSAGSGQGPINDGALMARRRSATVYGYQEPLNDTLTIAMMQIPPGQFLMGSPPRELERMEREGPQCEISLPRFFMGKYPITQSQWRFVVELPLVNRQLPPQPSAFTGDTLPVEHVSWYEAVEFCDRISRHTGRSYRLPTESEWEYACRAGTTTPFHFGQTITTDVANYRGTKAYDRGPLGNYRQTTTPVDHFDIANTFGLCEMHGNVWEWCQDPWHQDYGSGMTQQQVQGNVQANQATHRVVRGGSWYSTPERCRAASRFHFRDSSSHHDVGFRVICALNQQPN